MSKWHIGGTMGMNNIEIGMRIQQIRRERNITREDLAEQAGVSIKFLYEVESGKKGLSAESIYKVSTALSVSCDYLLKGEEKLNYDNSGILTRKQWERLENIMKLIDEFYKDL